MSWWVDYGNFRLTLKRLEEQHENYLHASPRRSELDRDGVAESVVRRFEICYDCLWKVLKRYLTDELGVAETPNSPKPVFRLARENGLLDEPLEQWFRYANARIDTSPDYDVRKAGKCLALMPDFREDAVALYLMLSRKSWWR